LCAKRTHSLSIIHYQLSIFPIAFSSLFSYNKAKGYAMKKSMLYALCSMLCIGSADAYQVMSSKELGTGEARNQNIVVKCTTPSGQVSTQTCSMRRYVKCAGKTCNGWQPWKELRDPNTNHSDWKSAASSCCQAKGLR
jgi:hypothetical protein